MKWYGAVSNLNLEAIDELPRIIDRVKEKYCVLISSTIYSDKEKLAKYMDVFGVDDLAEIYKYIEKVMQDSLCTKLNKIYVYYKSNIVREYDIYDYVRL